MGICAKLEAAKNKPTMRLAKPLHARGKLLIPKSVTATQRLLIWICFFVQRTARNVSLRTAVGELEYHENILGRTISLLQPEECSRTGGGNSHFIIRAVYHKRARHRCPRCVRAKRGARHHVDERRVRWPRKDDVVA